MRLLNLRINLYLLRTFCPHLGSFCVVTSFTTFRPNFTTFRWFNATSDINAESCNRIPSNYWGYGCLSHHVFDQVNLWPAWVGFETAIVWQRSPGTVETQRLYPLHHDQGWIFWSYKSLSGLPESVPRWGQKVRNK